LQPLKDNGSTATKTAAHENISIIVLYLHKNHERMCAIITITAHIYFANNMS